MVKDEFDFGFAVDLMHKDLNLVQNQAQILKANTPLVDLTFDYLERSKEAGENKLDATVIIRRYLNDYLV